jgi:hypothetical protein
LRLIFDAPGTVAGFRRWVLMAAPIAPGFRAKTSQPDQNVSDSEAVDPAASREPQAQLEGGPGELSHDQLAPGEKKREALIRLYERCGETGDPRYGSRAKAASLAGEIAGRIGYHPGTARRELVKYLAAQSPTAPDPQPESGSQAEAVA